MAMVLLFAAVEAETCDNGCLSSPQIIMVIIVMATIKSTKTMMIILQMWKQDGELLRQTEMERRWHCGAVCRQNDVVSFNTSKTDVALWCYMRTDLVRLDGSVGGVMCS